MRHYGSSEEQALDPPLNISYLLIELVYQMIYDVRKGNRVFNIKAFAKK